MVSLKFLIHIRDIMVDTFVADLYNFAVSKSLLESNLSRETCPRSF